MFHAYPVVSQRWIRFNRRFFPFNAFRSLLGIGTAMEPTTYATLYNTARRRPKPPGRKAPIGN
jgi:hypothetical protein